MNYIYFVRKPTFLISSLQLSRLHINIAKCHVRKMCTSPGFKLHTNSENKDADSTMHRKSVHSHKESDEFGTLKTPLENRFKSKRTVFNNSKMIEKKAIKVKKPVSDESDVFGNLSERQPLWYSDFKEEPKDDNDLSDDSVIVKKISKRFRCPKKYLQEMKQLVEKKKIKDALELFVDMKRNFVTPEIYHYTYMIGVCGRIGYTEMAFKLLRQLSDRSYKPTPATLTGLFNSCAETPFPEYGLKKALLLKDKIKEKNWNLTQFTYHAMIKAFGKCGDLMTAFKVVDEMTKADIEIDASTYNFLLVSCISNKEAGFTYAVEVWRKMKAKKCKPDVFTCNLLLRAARDCDIGPDEISCLLLQHWSSYSKRPYGFITKESLSKEPVLKLHSGTNNIVSEPSEDIQKDYHDVGSNSEKLNESLDKMNLSSYDLQNVPNKSVIAQNSETSSVSLLSARPKNGPEILEIVNIKTPSDRLSLIGGFEGFLKFLFESKIKPNIKTFALLLECLPDNIKDEEKLLSIIDSYEIKPTIEFFNALIKKRNFRKETEAARQVLLLINKYELVPDIMTFGVLALGCRNLQHACRLIDEMNKFGASPNIEIAGCMVRQACMHLNFSYMKYVLELMEEQKIVPDEKVLLTLEKTLSDTRKHIILVEQGKETNEFYKQRKNLQTDFKEFYYFYEEWLKRMTYESEKHPWLQYKADIIDRTKKEEVIH